MISALAQVSVIEGGDRYLSAARKSADFILANLVINKTLKRRYCDKEAKFDGVLEDYSFIIQGLLNLFQASSDSRYFNEAVSLQDVQDHQFWDSINGGYYFSNFDSVDIITRKKDFNDGATPSGNSVSALNLLKLYQLSGESRFIERYRKLKAAMIPHVSKYPGAFTTFLSALDFELEGLSSESIYHYFRRLHFKPV